MPVLPIAHFTWQVLRTVKRSKKPPEGRTLRLVPNRRTKDGSFLNDLVEAGLLTRASGTAEKPFDATYALTERGEQAAEYGECEQPTRLRAQAEPKAKPAKKPKAKPKTPKAK